MNNKSGADASPSTPAFQLSDVRFKHVLNIESLQIDSCRVSAIVGPSGGGKTTLLRILNRMTNPDSGQVLFFAEPVEEMNPVQLRRRVTMLTQMPVIFTGSVQNNLLIGCRLAEKEQPSAEAIAAIMARVGLDKELSADAARLSGGEKQRLALARVMLMDPEVMLLDEPSASLDEETEVLIFDLVTEFCREHSKTLVMVTHSEKGFAGYYDTLIRIRGGQVEQVARQSRR
ncbi:MAG: ATP-binding cassette domain-containing protein [Spirochaetaceae bacterium]|nr:MAG: ATP-binding cassette domain-containing protein [Spirochaetaceae bacterium]